MKFMEITEKCTVHPGEYLLYSPTNQVVLCGAFSRSENYIRALAHGKYIEDKIELFRKIEMTRAERKERFKKRRCKGCKE